MKTRMSALILTASLVSGGCSMFTSSASAPTLGKTYVAGGVYQVVKVSDRVWLCDGTSAPCQVVKVEVQNTNQNPRKQARSEQAQPQAVETPATQPASVQSGKGRTTVGQSPAKNGR